MLVQKITWILKISKGLLANQNADSEYKYNDENNFSLLVLRAEVCLENKIFHKGTVISAFGLESFGAPF